MGAESNNKPSYVGTMDFDTHEAIEAQMKEIPDEPREVGIYLMKAIDQLQVAHEMYAAGDLDTVKEYMTATAATCAACIQQHGA